MTDVMHLALEEARLAAAEGEVPVGAVVVDPDGNVVARDHNRREAHEDPTAHAEILALRTAAENAGTWRLDGHTMFVTLEPCAMCAGAVANARLAQLVYGAADLNAGACWSLFNVPQDRRLNHFVEMEAGVMAEEASRLLADFFASRR